MRVSVNTNACTQALSVYNISKCEYSLVLYQTKQFKLFKTNNPLTMVGKGNAFHKRHTAVFGEGNGDHHVGGYLEPPDVIGHLSDHRAQVAGAQVLGCSEGSCSRLLCRRVGDC